MRRTVLVLLAGLGLMLGVTAFGFAVAGSGPPITLLAKQHTVRGKPQVLVSWSDTNSLTVVRTDVRRRSTGADTFWITRGYTTGKLLSFYDAPVTFGKIYRYEARDSISGAALTAWSDSVSITVTHY